MKKEKFKLEIFIVCFAILLLLFFMYFNDLRNLIFPFKAIFVPSILIFSIISFLLFSRFKIRTCGNWDKIVIISMILFSILVMFNNVSPVEGILSGGLLQLYTMVILVIFSYKTNKWSNFCFKSMIVFVLIHAVSTIIFYYRPELYNHFANIAFSGKDLKWSLIYYNYGYMSGLCQHFSSNGMILSIGLFPLINYFIKTKKEEKTSKKLFVLGTIILIVFYALILSSKRAPLLAACVALVFTYIIYNKKNLSKRIILTTIGLVCFLGIFNFSSNYIPGLSTIAHKNEMLENSEGGLLSGRKLLWGLAFDMFKNNPIIGNGYGSYYDTSVATNAISNTAHNYYLQLLAEEGIIGLILYLIPTLLLLRTSIILIHKSNNKNINLELCFAIEVQIFVLIYNLTASSLMYYYILIPLYLSYCMVRSNLIDSKENKGDGD